MGVTNNRAAGRYELEVDGETAYTEYRAEGDRIVFTHTVVPPALEGRGLGSTLLAGALEQVRDEGRKVVPLCSFVRRYMETHRSTQDLLD